MSLLPTRPPPEREAIAAKVLLRTLPGSWDDPATLLAEDFAGALLPLLPAADRWSRRTWGGLPATAWPPLAPRPRIALRLAKARREQDMHLALMARRLADGGEIRLYGFKDEGIVSNARRLGQWFETVEELDNKHRVRVIRLAGPKPALPTPKSWARSSRLSLNGIEREWISYPGLFAHERLDPGTQLLLDHLPPVGPEDSVLDVGCGDGILSAGLRARDPQGTPAITLLDHDALALEAARHNVPGAKAVLADSVEGLDEQFRWVISNPPIHLGVSEDHGFLDQLITALPRLLSADGEARLVLQHRLPLDRQVAAAGLRGGVLAHTGAYRIWVLRP